jgi:hypothetical protein
MIFWWVAVSLYAAVVIVMMLRDRPDGGHP